MLVNRRRGGKIQAMRALRILLVEDDSMIGMFLGMTIEQMGHEVCAVETTEAGAVDAAERLQPDLMIVDTGLKTGDGVTAVERILGQRVVRFMFSSGDLTKVRARFPNAVMIQKPYNDTELARAIGTAMEGASSSPDVMARASSAKL
jgi:DNA-binding response OmpR family regulator